MDNKHYNKLSDIMDASLIAHRMAVIGVILQLDISLLKLLSGSLRSI